MIKKIIAVLITLCLLFSMLLTVAAETVSNNPDTSDSAIAERTESKSGYQQYLEKYNSIPVSDDRFEAEIPVTEGKEYNGLYILESESGQLKVEVPSEGLYNIRIKYVALPGANNWVEAAIKINGEFPFDGADQLEFNKIFEIDGEIRQDNRNNDIRSEQKEKVREQDTLILDNRGYFPDAYKFYLKKGENTIEFSCSVGAFCITALSFEQEVKILSYNEYLKSQPESSELIDTFIKIDAEKPFETSAPTLFAKTDKTSANVDPPANGKQKLNVFGGVSFNKNAQWVSYEFDVENAGYYYLDIKYKQNFSNGSISYRDILIDDKLLFDDMKSVEFPFGASWKSKTITVDNGAGGETAKIYLSKGRHYISIEVVLSEYGQIINRVSESLDRLSEAYRESIMYLTATPDTLRDYDVENNLPHVIDLFREEVEFLKETSEEIIKTSGKKNDITAIIDRLVYQLEKFIKDPEELPKKLSQFGDNVTSLGALISLMEEQPLLLDYILFYSPDYKPKAAEASFVANIWNEIKNFAYSFFESYGMVGSEYSEDESVKAWITSGRDQAQVLKRLIDSDFTKNKDIGVNLELVQPAMLLPAVVSGIGPDVVLQVANTEPVNYAIRGAVYDLTNFNDHSEIITRFTESAVVPLTFDGKLYGLPETENFIMMFYRKDILSSMNLDVPNTWSDVLTLITELKKKNLMFGMPQGPGANITSVGMILNQFGGSFYKDDTYLSALDEEESVRAFTYLTDMFLNYQLPREYDPLTRFRIGEMPVLIADYSLYNKIQVGAPELRGKWDFAPVPGTLKEDGTIDRSVINGGLSVMMLNSAKSPDKSWEFMKWWTSTEVQIKYGREMEMALGVSARVHTANIEAISSLAWTADNIKNINAQREWVKPLESVPGGYFTTRHIDNAFRKVVISNGEPRDTLKEYVLIIDNEIKSKSEELGVSLERK